MLSFHSGDIQNLKFFNELGTMLVGITDISENNIYLYKDNGELLNGVSSKRKFNN